MGMGGSEIAGVHPVIPGNRAKISSVVWKKTKTDDFFPTRVFNRVGKPKVVYFFVVFRARASWERFSWPWRFSASASVPLSSV